MDNNYAHVAVKFQLDHIASLFWNISSGSEVISARAWATRYATIYFKKQWLEGKTLGYTISSPTKEVLDFCVTKIDLKLCRLTDASHPIFAFKSWEKALNVPLLNRPIQFNRDALTAVIALCIWTWLHRQRSDAYLRVFYFAVHRLLPMVLAPMRHGTDTLESIWNNYVYSSVIQSLDVQPKPLEWLDDILRGIITHAGEIQAAYNNVYKTFVSAEPLLNTSLFPPPALSREVDMDAWRQRFKVPPMWNLSAPGTLMIAACLSRYVHLNPVPRSIVEWLDRISPGCTGSDSFRIMQRHARARHDHETSEIVAGKEVIEPHMASKPKKGTTTDHVWTLMIWIRGLWFHMLSSQDMSPEPLEFVFSTRKWSGDETRYRGVLETALFFEASRLDGKWSDREGAYGAPIANAWNGATPRLVLTESHDIMPIIPFNAIDTSKFYTPHEPPASRFFERIQAREASDGASTFYVPCAFLNSMVTVHDPVAASWLYRYQFLGTAKCKTALGETTPTPEMIERYVFGDLTLESFSTPSVY